MDISMFPNSQNAQISGGTFNIYGGGSTNNEALKILSERVARGAFHNSGERFDAPKCHPNTRVAILEKLTSWINDKEGPHAMWLRGAAGAGKTSIAQKFAKMCSDQGRLSSSFFFSRSSTTDGNTDNRLVPTLAYQLYQHVPETRPFISSTILNNPLVFDLTLEAQADALIVDPLSRLSHVELNPMVIIVDGLDECNNKENAQSRLIDALFSILTRIQHKVSHKVLMTSRPEGDIEAAFSAYEDDQVLTLSLDDRVWKAEDDIRLYLVDSFAQITRTHPLKRSLKADWPPPTDNIETLVRKASGQFIYPSVVVNYIKSIRHNPRDRMKVILGLAKDDKTSPYAVLDDLYSHIFSSVENLHLVLSVLRIALTDAIPGGLNLDFDSSPIVMGRKLFGVSEADIQLAFIDLVSIIEIDNECRQPQIRFLHASLPEYLIDQNRSGKYCIDTEAITVDIAESYFKYKGSTLSPAIAGMIHLAFNVEGFLWATSGLSDSDSDSDSD